jgi:hypothetical protein
VDTAGASRLAALPVIAVMALCALGLVGGGGFAAGTRKPTRSRTLTMVMGRIRRALAALAAVAAAALAGAPAASAAGETTHAFMAERAIAHLPDGPLRTLLSAQVVHVLGGAGYPDTGYWVENGAVPVRGLEPRASDDYGEASHWEPFVNAYVEHLRERGCGEPTLPAGPCAELVAHLMGAAAHGMGDEVWDWLFEPRVTDHGEDAARNFFAEGRPGHAAEGNPLDEASSSIEYAMDEVAILDHFRWVSPNTAPPPVADLVEVYARMGLAVTPEHMLAGHAVSSGAMAAERAVAPVEAPRIREDMPWSAANFVTEAGGVEYTARAIAGYYEAVWRKLTEPEHPAPRPVAVHPEPDARDAPYVWQPPRTSPGPHTGGGEQRVLAVLSNAVDPASVTPDTFRLLAPDGGDVPPLAGFPKAGPYGADQGTHTMLLYPAVDLEPCTRYTAVLTTGLRDLAGAPLEREHRWSFTTRPAPGAACD